ncbi:TPA: hypothetical protein QCH83_000896 [Enterobacter bugandensis]|nr:hypothetical protein [Enterobacter bugandensis]
MKFKFLIDEFYLSFLFTKIEDNLREIEWFVELHKIIPGYLGDIYITKHLLSKSYNGVDNSDIFFPANGKSRDIALKFGLTQQRYFKKYAADEFINMKQYGSHEFVDFILNNELTPLITKFNYQNEGWWNTSIVNNFSIDDDPVICTRNLTSLHDKCTDDMFRSLVPVLFPNIYFDCSNRTKLENFEISPIPMKWVIDSLSYLNDSAIEDYRKNPGQFMIEASQKGHELSPESKKTRKALKLMKERDVNINDSNVCCEWHFKYSKTNGGRIHFHFGYDVDDKAKAKTNGNPIVGIFAHHLEIAK